MRFNIIKIRKIRKGIRKLWGVGEENKKDGFP